MTSEELTFNNVILNTELEILNLIGSSHIRNIHFVLKIGVATQQTHCSFMVQSATEAVELPKNQHPVKACLAIKINTAQGQVFCGAVGLDFSDSVFSHRHGYVGESTVRRTRIQTQCIPSCEINTQAKNVAISEAGV